MVENDFASILKALKTPEARAAVIYDLFKGREIISPIPPELEDGARQAVGIAFEAKNYRTGFVIAEQAGILEKILEDIDKVPGRIELAWDKPVPDSVKQIPGYKEPDSTMTQHKIYELNQWITGIRKSLVNDFLIPNKRFREACEKLIDLGENQNAVALGFNELSIEEAAEVCERANCSFSTGIRMARENQRPDLQKRLQQSHVNSTKAGKMKDWCWSPHHIKGNYLRAVALAREYEFEEGEINGLVDEGIRDSLDDFSGRLFKWQSELKQINEARWGYHRRDVSERQAHKEYERESRLREERCRYVCELDSSAEELIGLVKLLPKEATERVNAIKGTLYKVCDDYNSNCDAFGIANAFGDLKLAVEYGSRIISGSGHDFWLRGSAERVKSIVEERILDEVDEDSRKRYIDALRWQGKEHGGYEPAFRVAKKYGLDEYLMQGFERDGHLREAAHVAANIGKREKSKELFARGRFYEAAAQQTDSGLEKAVFYLLSTEEKIEWRNKFTVSSTRRDEVNKEIEIMRNAVGLCDNKNAHDYFLAVSRVVRALFNGNEYARACLFAEETGISPEALKSFVTDEVFQAAERARDFAGCYHLARLAGREDEAAGYRALALQLKQTIPGRLDDFVYVKPVSVERRDNGEVDF